MKTRLRKKIPKAKHANGEEISKGCRRFIQGWKEVSHTFDDPITRSLRKHPCKIYNNLRKWEGGKISVYLVSKSDM